MNPWIIGITGIIGTIGFALLMNVQKNRLLFVGIGGMITSFSYAICLQYLEGVFIINFIPTLLSALYCEIMARVLKAPVTVFSIPCIVVLAPGGYLYNTMYHMILGNKQEMAMYGSQTVQVAMAIALGIVVISILFPYMRGVINRLTLKDIK